MDKMTESSKDCCSLRAAGLPKDAQVEIEVIAAL
jgi:hypothetical protein